MTKCAIVTGASSGIGKATVQQLLVKHYEVHGIDISDNPYPSALNYIHHKCDVSSRQELVETFDYILTNISRIDVLVNNAGILDDYKSLNETNWVDISHVMEVNFYSQIFACQLVLNTMINQGYGRIINVSSVAGKTAGGGGIAYTCSKHAVEGLTKQLAYEYGQYGLRVNAVAPGAIVTGINKEDFENGAEIANSLSKKIPVKRYGLPTEVAKLIVYLADEDKYINGESITIDGAWIHTHAQPDNE